MKPHRIKITKSQTIDGELTSTETLGFGSYLSEDGSRVRFESETDDIVLSFGPQEVVIKTFTSEGSSQALLRLRQMTTGRYAQGDYLIEFAFQLNALHHAGLNVFMQYDIYQNGEKIAENALRTEVIEA